MCKFKVDVDEEKIESMGNRQYKKIVKMMMMKRDLGWLLCLRKVYITHPTS